MSTRRFFSMLIGLAAMVVLAACGGSAAATPTMGQQATATVAPTPTLGATATSAPRQAGSAQSPILARPTGATAGSRAGTVLPLPGGQAPTPAALSAGAVAANSDGSCPPGQPIKAVGLGKSYHVQDQASYARARAEECFATESDAQAAGYRKAAR